MAEVWQDECHCKQLNISAPQGPECSCCEGLEGSGNVFHDMLKSIHSWAWVFDVNVVLGNLS